MSALSSPYYLLKDRYDVVVVGSGYGASVAASRFSRAGYRVCVLERGKEYLSKDFPDSAASAAPELQAVASGPLASALPENPLGLYEFRLNKDLDVLAGCGLGGTSLINANVSLKPDPRVFEDKAWPSALRIDAEGLRLGYERARAMLRPAPYPAGTPGYPELPKTRALKESGKALGRKAGYVDVNVNFDVDGKNHVGVAQRPCNNCGDCCSGCRYGAKNTLDKNYLPDAKNHGARIFTQMRVSHVGKNADGSWNVYYFQQPGKPDKNTSVPSFVRADIVVLGAGSVGSTEILLRSKARGLALSERLGEGFSGNGDVLAFAYNADREVRAVGFGKDDPASAKPVGPCITAAIDARDAGRPLEEGMIIEEGSIPGALGPLLPALFSAGARAFGQDADMRFPNETKEAYREIESLTQGAKKGATLNTQVCLVMSHDGQAGKIALENDKARVEWDGYAGLPGFRRVAQAMKTAAEALHGTYLENPLSAGGIGKRLITVHPLGGCPAGDDRRSGVVDHRCEAFDAAADDPAATHAGLYVMDGAVLPRSLGVNPLFTICALAERAAALACLERGRTPSYDFADADMPLDVASAPGVTFTETMRGFAMIGAADFQEGFDQGKARGEADAGLMFRLTATMHDMEAFIAKEEHRGSLTGYVRCPLLASRPLSVSEGEFNLFTLANDKKTRHMRYRMVLTAETGERYYFDGRKDVRRDDAVPLSEIWNDTSTLYVAIYKGGAPSGDVFVRGAQKILIPDFVAQVKTICATRINDPKKAAAAVARFGKFFLGQLWEAYGEEGRAK
jgi:cholesterol oxidase